MKKIILMFCFCLFFVQISDHSFAKKKYPEIEAKPGSLSYKPGTNFKKWQKKFYKQFIKAMGLNSNQVISKFARKKPEYYLNSLNLGQTSKLSQYLKSVYKKDFNLPEELKGSPCNTMDARGRPLYADFYPPKYVNKINHVVLYSCKKDDKGIRVYQLTYKSFDGHPISSFLLVPNNSNAKYYAKAGGKVPTLIYYHGHLSTKEDAAFNPHSYTRGVAYHAALNGFLVLVPDVRGFGESERTLGHKAQAQKFRQQGMNFMSAVAMDAIYAQDVLESLNLKDFGLNYKIDPGFNMIAGVSLGGGIALTTGALDRRFDYVSSHSIFIGYEFLFSEHHCHCQQIPKAHNKFNVFDVAALIPPGTLHVGMGAKDPIFNLSAKSALTRFTQYMVAAKQNVCMGQFGDANPDFILDKELRSHFRSGMDCPFVLEVMQDSVHEVIGYGYHLHILWHEYLR